MQEISFNSSLMREMRHRVRHLAIDAEGKMAGGKRMFTPDRSEDDPVGRIEQDERTWKFLTYLFELGRERCDKWLAEITN